MPEPDFKDELDPMANVATAVELQADLDVLMFLNDPQHTAASLATALKEYVEDAGQAAEGILERRGKIGAFTSHSELGAKSRGLTRNRWTRSCSPACGPNGLKRHRRPPA